MIEENNIVCDEKQIAEIDSKITIRLKKEQKRSSTTYIFGLDKFMTSENIKILTSHLKKMLGTQHIEREEQENKKKYKIYGFSGDHRERIKQYLIEKNIADDEKIVVKM